MNFILFFALLISSLNLFRGYYKGYSHKIDKVFDFISFVFTLVPCLVNFLIFLKSNVDHRKVLKVNFYKFFLLDYYGKFKGRKVLEGTWPFCSGGENCRVWDGKEKLTPFGVVSESERTDKFDARILEECDFICSSEVVKRGVGDCINKEGFSLLKNLNKMVRVRTRKNHPTIVDNIFINHPIKILQEDFHEIDIIHYLCKDDVFSYKVTDERITVRLLEDHDIVKTIDHGLNLKQKQQLCTLLKIKSDGACVIYNKWKTRKGINVLHSLNYKEIIDGIKRNHGTSHLPGIVDGVTVFEGAIEKEKESEELITKCSVDNINRSPIQSMYGENLGNFIVDYAIKVMGKASIKAIDFLSRKSSMWGYREIGKNWQSKRFLTDICYILEVAGAPRLTHIDRSINPTKRVIRIRDQIPACDKVVKRKIIDYDLIKVKNETIEVSRNEGPCEELRNLRKSLKPLSMHKRGLFEKRTAIEAVNSKSLKWNNFRVRQELAEKEKIVESTNDFYKGEKSSLKTYKSVLLSGVEKKIPPMEAAKVEEGKDGENYNELKACIKQIRRKKCLSIDLERLKSTECLLNKSIEGLNEEIDKHPFIKISKGDRKILSKTVDNRMLVLNNRYSVLRDFIEIIEEEINETNIINETVVNQAFKAVNKTFKNSNLMPTKKKINLVKSILNLSKSESKEIFKIYSTIGFQFNYSFFPQIPTDAIELEIKTMKPNASLAKFREKTKIIEREPLYFRCVIDYLRFMDKHEPLKSVTIDPSSLKRRLPTFSTPEEAPSSFKGKKRKIGGKMLKDSDIKRLRKKLMWQKTLESLKRRAEMEERERKEKELKEKEILRRGLRFNVRECRIAEMGEKEKEEREERKMARRLEREKEKKEKEKRREMLMEERREREEMKEKELIERRKQGLADDESPEREWIPLGGRMEPFEETEEEIRKPCPYSPDNFRR
jgi:hypothetical protein